MHRDVYNFFPPARLLPAKALERVLTAFGPFHIQHLKEIRSLTGSCVEGHIIVCPLLSKQFLKLNEDFVNEKLLRAVRIAEKLGVKFLGLGAFAGAVGEGGKLLSGKTGLKMTNGTSFAAAAILENISRAAALRSIDLSRARVAIIGATNAIGQNCAYSLNNRVAVLGLFGKNSERLRQLGSLLQRESRSTEIRNFGMDTGKFIPEADIVIFTTTAMEVSLKPCAADFKRNAVICDLPSPRNVPRELAVQRSDILVIDSAVIKPPGEIRLKIRLPLPEFHIYACMAETMILTFERRFQENYSIGYSPDLKKIEEIAGLAGKHGFEITFNSFGKPITSDADN
ncbi:MAG: hypothetical protein PHT59_01465 [Candidatus Omnitrophica bacterium]|nr:hypothetical protein [Candidatus Omnitrophota bacterium]